MTDVDKKPAEDIEKISLKRVREDACSGSNKIRKVEDPALAKWRADKGSDTAARKYLLAKIVYDLRQRMVPRPLEEENEVEKNKRRKNLQDIAKIIELCLYRASKSREEYLNQEDIEDRIKGTLEGRYSPTFLKVVKNNNISLEDLFGSLDDGKPSSSSEEVPGRRITVTTQPAKDKVASSIDKRRPSLVQSNDAGYLQSYMEDQTKEVIECRRQRLLCLQHASACKEDPCSVLKCCKSMKTVWKHVIVCQQAECSTACISARRLLWHFRNCADTKCPVCSAARANNNRKQKASTAVVSSTGKEALVNEVKARPIDPRFARSCVSGSGPNFFQYVAKKYIQRHLHQLRVEKLQPLLMPVLRKFMEHRNNNNAFNLPVDPIKLNIPTYFDIIKHPMDLGTMRQRLIDGRYERYEEFDRDIRLVFDNAMTFNGPQYQVHISAAAFKKTYEQDAFKLISRVKKLKEHSTPHGNCNLCFQSECEVCPLCERGCLAFEPKVFYCSGFCNSRIQRNTYFYCTPSLSYCFCTECYDKHKKKLTLEVGGGVVLQKSDLEKRRNNELSVEPWVSCDKCSRWMHQVCAMFNDRKDDPRVDNKYCCPLCLLEEEAVPTAGTLSPCSTQDVIATQESKVKEETIVTMKEESEVKKKEKLLVASDLPRTHLGDFIECWIRNSYEKLHEKEKETPSPIPCQPGPPSSSLNIRVLNNAAELCKVKASPRMAFKNFPEKLPYFSKCVCLFQELDGIDVLIYVMFVQEYGSDCPMPNKETLYIAYLDSVHFFSPRRMRTEIYHELLLSYLEYSRRIGYTRAYIWACPPPNKRDDYILHCHPEDQRVPNADRLRKWYELMAEKGIEYGTVYDQTTLFEEHFPSKHAIQSKSADKSKTNERKKRRCKKSFLNKGKSTGKKKKGKRTPVRSGPSSPVGGASTLEFQEDPSSDHEANGEPLRHRNKSALYGNMPYFDGDYWPQELEEIARDENSKREKSSREGAGSRRASVAPKTPISGSDKKQEEGMILKGMPSDEIREVLFNRLGDQLGAMKQDFLILKLAPECSRCGKLVKQKRFECRHSSCLTEKGTCGFVLCLECVESVRMAFEDQKVLEKSTILKEEKDDVLSHITNGTILAANNSGALPKDNDALLKELFPVNSQFSCTRGRITSEASTDRHDLCFVREKVPEKVTLVGDVFTSKILKSRHTFLALCSANKYQFNQLRRAKFSTMMVLYHLHNPKAPAHLFTCQKCKRDILQGRRHTCVECTDFHMCEFCVLESGHDHKMNPFPISDEVYQVSSSETQRKKAEARRARHNSLYVFLRVLEHVGECNDKECKYAPCRSLRKLFKHPETCVLDISRCDMCRKLFYMTSLHAKSCKKDKCPLPNCAEWKAKRAKRLKEKGDGTPRIKNESTPRA